MRSVRDPLVRQAIAMALAVGAVGIAFGARASDGGLSLAKALALSALAASQLIIDQSAAAALAQPRPDRAWRAFWLTGVWVLVLWLAETAAGWAITGAIDIEAFGVDAAIPALFVALLAPRMRRPDKAATALAGGAIALALVPVAPAGVPILISALVVIVGLSIARRSRAT